MPSRFNAKAVLSQLEIFQRRATSSAKGIIRVSVPVPKVPRPNMQDVRQ